MAEVINYVEGEEEKRKMISWQENTKVSILYFREMLSLNDPTGGICITQSDDRPPLGGDASLKVMYASIKVMFDC